MPPRNLPTKKTELKKGQGLPDLRFYGDEFVFNTVTGMFYRLTPSAGLLLRCLDQGHGKDHLATILQEHYGVDPASAHRDIELFINDLVSLGILDSSPLPQKSKPSAS